MQLSRVYRSGCALLLLVATLAGLSGCAGLATPAAPTLAPAPPSPTPVAVHPAGISAPAADDLAGLSDEFDNTQTLANWQNHATVEGWPSQIDTLDINTTHPGELTLVPYTSTWFEDYRGVFLFKEVTGDFDVTTRIQATGKQTPLPRRTFSLTGLMARAPRDVTMATWTPGHENWVFITTGYGDGAPGRADKPQIETKTTTNSSSVLKLILSANGWVNLRVVRMGATFVMLYRLTAGGAWKISQRYERPDLPATLQVGLNAYTNWESIPEDQATFNRTLETKPALPPDLIARSDYIRFHRPQVTAAQLGAGSLSNDELVRLIGP